MPSDVALTVFSAVQWIIEVVSIVGNSLILSFVFSMKRTVRTTNMLTRVSLATSCLIFSLTAFIAHIMWEFDRANFNRTSFYLVCFNIRKCCSVVSYYTIALMAAQRYYAIKFVVIFKRTYKVFKSLTEKMCSFKRILAISFNSSSYTLNLMFFCLMFDFNFLPKFKQVLLVISGPKVQTGFNSFVSLYNIFSDFFSNRKYLIDILSPL